MLVAASKHFEKQALVAGTKQSKQAERAVRTAQCLFLFWARYYRPCFVEVDVSQTKMY
jgi:hypothetical protein